MVNKLIFAGLFTFSLVCGGLKAQEKVHVKRAEFLIQGTEGAKALKKVRKANRLMNKGIGFSKNALDLYLEAEEYNSENAELQYSIGVGCLLNGPGKEAYKHFKKAADLKPEIAKDIHFMLGLAHQARYEFTDAIAEYNKHIEMLQQKKVRRLSRSEKQQLVLCDKHIAECNSGEGFYLKDAELVLQNLEGAVNSEYDDFSPFIYSDSLMYFSSRRGGKNWKRRSPIDAKFYERVYQVDLQDGKLYNLQLTGRGLNKGRNAAVRGMISKDRLVVYRCKRRFGDLFTAKKGKNGWKARGRISGINKSKAHDASASLTKDGNTMYFVSNRKKGEGKHDIYWTVKTRNGNWSKPQNIGNVINTPYEEGDVFVTPDGKTLFFSSKGHSSMGGYDIFKSEKQEDGTWSKPVNLGYPINSVYNDINYAQTQDGKTFFLASDRDGGLGGYDLYRYVEPEIIPEPKKEIAQEEVVEQEVEVPEPMSVVEENPVQQEVVVEDFKYKVQIAACRKEMTIEDLHKRYKGQAEIEHLFVGGWHRYTIGNLASFDKAEVIREQSGVSDAFIVLFKGDHRLGMARKNQMNELDQEELPIQESDVLYYRVQILASNRMLSEAEIANLKLGTHVVEHHFVEGLNCYTIGKFESYDEALKLKNTCKIDSAFVVLFQGDNRLDIAKKQ